MKAKKQFKYNCRKNQPWIVVYGHRPMYCSNRNNDDCTYHETVTRVGLPFTHIFGESKILPADLY